VSRVYLTDAGRRCEAPIREIFAEAERVFLRRLTKVERAQLGDLLDRIGPPRAG
jgi:DNA-binding MarR family transcriptional regulator